MQIRYKGVRAQWRFDARKSNRSCQLIVPDEFADDHALAGIAVSRSRGEFSAPILLYVEKTDWSTLSTREAYGLIKYVQVSKGNSYPGFTLLPIFNEHRSFVLHLPWFVPVKAHEVLSGTAVGDILVLADIALKELSYQVVIDTDNWQNTQPRPSFSKDIPPSVGSSAKSSKSSEDTATPTLRCSQNTKPCLSPKDTPLPPGFDVQVSECPKDTVARYSRIWIEVENCEAIVATDENYEVFLFSDDPEMSIKQRRQEFDDDGQLVDCKEDRDPYESWVTQRWSKNYFYLGRYYNKSLLKVAECRKFIDILLFLQDRNIVFSEIDGREISSVNGNKLREIPLIRVATDSAVIFSGGVTLGDRDTLKTSQFSLGKLVNPFRNVPDCAKVYSMSKMFDPTRPGSSSGFSVGQLVDPGGTDLGTAKTLLSDIKGQILISKPKTLRPKQNYKDEECACVTDASYFDVYIHLDLPKSAHPIRPEGPQSTQPPYRTCRPPSGHIPTDASAIRQILVNTSTVYISPCPRCSCIHVSMVCFVREKPDILVTVEAIEETNAIATRKSSWARCT